MATRARRRRTGIALLVRAAGAAVVVGGIAAAVTSSGGGADPRPAEADAAPAPASQTEHYAVAQAGDVAKASPVSGTAPVTTPAIPIGRTPLSGGVFAERVGDTVIVHFDTPDTRTRRSDKFERVVRETLPVVLGDAGRSAVEQLAPGKLVPAGQLIAMLDSGPLHLPIGDGRAIRMVPGARQGQDGPLVVTYRVVIETKGPSAS